MLSETGRTPARRPRPPERAIVELSLQGYTTTEIADRLRRSQRTVRRVRERIKHRLRRDIAEELARPSSTSATGRARHWHHVLNLTDEQWLRLERITGRFEEAWREGERPAIEDYLPSDPVGQSPRP